MNNKPSELLDQISPNRRGFVQTILGMAGFSAPSVRTFVIGSAAAMSAPTSLYAVTMAGVPEIDPESAGTALTLLAGAALVIRGKSRSKSQTNNTETSSETKDEQC